MTVFVTRHGRTDQNTRHLISGWSEWTLTEEGIAQAKALAARLKAEEEQNQIRHILVSPIQRARVTAGFIEEALGLKAVVEPRLRELNFGSEAETWNTRDPRVPYLRLNPFLRFPQGESLVDAASRLYRVVDELPERFHGDNVLLVCHGMAMALIDSYFHEYSNEDFLKVMPDNCELWHYELEKGRWN